MKPWEVMVAALGWVTTMILPNTGLPLPFVSYGLTSLVSMYCGIGIVLNIGLQRNKALV